MVNSSNFGFGIHNPDAVLTGRRAIQILQGILAPVDTTDNNTVYIGPQHIELLDYNIVYEYDFNLSSELSQASVDWVYTHRSDHRPDYYFGNSRRHWFATTAMRVFPPDSCVRT